ncbi:Hemerythrin-like metal-binding protein [Pseudodesulfovibrio profundus]|uniref:Hemerythrin-like metal-binding protein n=1 Tax=Pseudodesulfovibrio profundus TaxID=57320 RepID=A0A2C8F7U3_9BACT|nr:bacteriohemerythrin [Pseudodesulfovibrio profundus]MBC18120.1 hemerythrin [Desulfovibrio sp.]SOB58095.1 Hemerythrin-like metal-binding protein [Pseudodesulfovibrio profundus]|tara:strand:+ start:2946 stop:3338 length:393 start_codon:yes stop_codon:yes gene_type:complete
MGLIDWDETMSVGVEEIDIQHRQLILLVNESYEALQRHDEDKIPALLEKMKEYAAVHFETEESYMKRNNYPGLEAHKLKHVRFKKDVEEFQQKKYEKTNLSKLFVYLSRWLTRHIMDEDKRYTVYMRSKA